MELSLFLNNNAVEMISKYETHMATNPEEKFSHEIISHGDPIWLKEKGLYGTPIHHLVWYANPLITSKLVFLTPKGVIEGSKFIIPPNKPSVLIEGLMESVSESVHLDLPNLNNDLNTKLNEKLDELESSGYFTKDGDILGPIVSLFDESNPEEQVIVMPYYREVYGTRPMCLIIKETPSKGLDSLLLQMLEIRNSLCALDDDERFILLLTTGLEGIKNPL